MGRPLTGKRMSAFAAKPARMATFMYMNAWPDMIRRLRKQRRSLPDFWQNSGRFDRNNRPPQKKRSEVVETPVQAVHAMSDSKILEWAGANPVLMRIFRRAPRRWRPQVEFDRSVLGATDGDTLPRMESWAGDESALQYEHPITKDVYGKLFASISRNEAGVEPFSVPRAKSLVRGFEIWRWTPWLSPHIQRIKLKRVRIQQGWWRLDTIKLLVLYLRKIVNPSPSASSPGTSLTRSRSPMRFDSLTCSIWRRRSSWPTTGSTVRTTWRILPASTRSSWCSPTVPTSGFAQKSTPHAKSSGTSGTSARLTSMSAASCAAGSTSSASCENARAGISKLGRRNRLRDACTSMYFTNRKLLRFRSAGFARAFSHSRRIWRTASRNFGLLPRSKSTATSRWNVRQRGSRSTSKWTGSRKQRYWNYFVLVSNEIKDPLKRWRHTLPFPRKDQNFSLYKDSFDGRKPRTWYPENLYGRQFAQFVGLGYHCFLAKRILDVKKALSEKETEEKTKEELNLEAKLLAWLNQHSLIQILDWFRCVDYVAATGNASASKWTTETTRRDQLFLKMLGVKWFVGALDDFKDKKRDTLLQYPLRLILCYTEILSTNLGAISIKVMI